MNETMLIVQPPGSELYDEIYTHSVYGTYNVALMRRAIDDGRLRFTAIQFPLNETWGRMVDESDINPETLAKVTIFDVAAYPCLFMWTGKNDAIILDGMHRMAFAVKRGLTEMRGHFIQKKDADPFRIRYFLNDKEISPEELLQMTWGKYPKVKKRR